MNNKNLRDIRISLFLFPWEIDKLEYTLLFLKRNLILLSEEERQHIITDITLNVSDDIINWVNSSLSKDYIIDKFKILMDTFGNLNKLEYNMDINNEIKGCVDKRRECFNKSNNNTDILWLDLDLYFPDTLLFYIFQTNKILRDNDLKYYIITPDINKYWDNSWNTITNEKYLNDKYDRYYDYIQLTNIDRSNVELYENRDYIKFGGGWFNLFSYELLNMIPIPITFSPYGLEDTYITEVCNKLIKSNIVPNIKQYILKNIIITERKWDNFTGYNNYMLKYFDIKLPPKNTQIENTLKHYHVEMEELINMLSSKKINNIKEG